MIPVADQAPGLEETGPRRGSRKRLFGDGLGLGLPLGQACLNVSLLDREVVHLRPLLLVWCSLVLGCRLVPDIEETSVYTSGLMEKGCLLFV